MADNQYLTTNKNTFLGTTLPDPQGIVGKTDNSIFMGAQKIRQYIPSLNFNTLSFMPSTQSEIVDDAVNAGYKPLYDRQGNFSGQLASPDQQKNPVATNNVANNVSLPVFKSNYQPLNAPVAGNIGSINPYQFQNNGVNALGISQDMINRAGQYNPMVNQDAFNQRQIQANEYANLDNAYRGQHLSNFMNAGSLADFFGAAIIGHQDRAGMARATELLKQNNQLVANNIENINDTNLQNIENQRQTGLGLGNIANSQNQIANNLQESQAKNLIDTAKFNLDANRENFNQANSSYQNQINAQMNYPKLAYLSDIKQMQENPISLNTDQAKLVAMQNGTDYNLVKQQVGGSEYLANKMLSNKLMQNNLTNAVMKLNLGNGQMPGLAPAETTQIIYDENNNKVMEIKGTAQAVLNAQKQFPSFNPLGNNTIPVAQNGATIVQK